MFSNFKLRSVVFGLAAVALSLSGSTASVLAANDTLATVAILLPNDPDIDLDNCLEDAVAIVLNQNPKDDNRDILALESGGFGEFSGDGLVPVSAKYITRGSIYKTVVYGLASSLPPTKGAMLFDPNSDVTIEFCGFANANGDTLEEELIPSAASYLLVIVTGTVH